MKTCPECGGTFEEEIRFCPTDGSKLEIVNIIPSSTSYQTLDQASRFEIEKEIQKTSIARYLLLVDREFEQRALAVVYNSKISSILDRQKAKKLLQVSHPNLVRTLAFNSNENNEIYVVYEYVEGQKLTDLIEKGLDQRKSTNIAKQLISCALAFHQRSVFHKSIDPDNVFVERNSIALEHVYLSNSLNFYNLDLQQYLEADELKNNLFLQHVYSQFSKSSAREFNEAKIDIYCVSLILAGMVFGKNFLSKISSIDAFRVTDFVNEIARSKPDLSVELLRIINRGLTVNIANHYQNGKELLSDLTKLAEQQIADEIQRKSLMVSTSHKTVVGGNLDQFGRFQIKEIINKDEVSSNLLLFDTELNSNARAVVYTARATRLMDQQKAQKLMQVSHPNLVKILAFNRTQDGQLYAVYESVEGRTLKEMIKEGMNLEKAIHLTKHLASCVAAFHKYGIFHGQLNPENVLVEGAEISHLRVLNPINTWNLKISEDLENHQETVAMVFTDLCYQPPECSIEENVEPGPAADFYAITMMLVEMIVGQSFPHEKLSKIFNQTRKFKILEPLLSLHVSDLPDSLWTLIRRGLALKPEERYQNALQMLEDIETISQQISSLLPWRTDSLQLAALANVELKVDAKGEDIGELQDIQYLNEVMQTHNQEMENKLTKLSQQLDSFQKASGLISAMDCVHKARHPERPYTLDFVGMMFEDFQEIHGDRRYSDDPAIVTGLAKFFGQPIVVIGHQKSNPGSRKTQDRAARNFGMPKPEGYRKALRIMKLAEKFNRPIFTFIDTPGAYPGIDAEQRGQAEAIARNLIEMARLRVPIIVTIIGEGGSGGALAIGVGDIIYMLKNSIYSVISPEGCAAILWKDSAKANQAAENLHLISSDLKALGIVDQVIDEPEDGAHKDPQKMAQILSSFLREGLQKLSNIPMDELIAHRYRKFRAMGVFLNSPSNGYSDLNSK
jgi:acetyl-CoA carboxylase carboxyl transferase subunit alpha